MADTTADRGVAAHASGLLQLATYYAAKQKHYIAFIKRVHRMFLRVLEREHKLREESDRAVVAKHKASGNREHVMTQVPRTYRGPGLLEGSRLSIEEP